MYNLHYIYHNLSENNYVTTRTEIINSIKICQNQDNLIRFKSIKT